MMHLFNFRLYIFPFIFPCSSFFFRVFSSFSSSGGGGGTNILLYPYLHKYFSLFGLYPFSKSTSVLASHLPLHTIHRVPYRLFTITHNPHSSTLVGSHSPHSTQFYTSSPGFHMDPHQSVAVANCRCQTVFCYTLVSHRSTPVHIHSPHQSSNLSTLST
jgi:hypothetical protein